MRRTMIVGILAFVPSVAFADDIFVDINVAVPGSGGTWGSAFRFIQDALENANPSDVLFVAEGVYYVQDGLNVIPTDVRESVYKLPNNVSIIGSFPTGGAPTPSPSIYKTVLTSDIAKNDGTEAQIAAAFIADPPTYGFLSDNAYHCLDLTQTDTDSEVSGLVIQCGHADGVNDKGNGAGIFCGAGTPLIDSCTVQYCRAPGKTAPPTQLQGFDGMGAGLYSTDGDLEIRGTKFFRNHGFWGAGFYKKPTVELQQPVTDVLLVGCTIQENRSFTLCVQPVGGGQCSYFTTRGGGATFDHWLGFVDQVNCAYLYNRADDNEGGEGSAAAMMIGLPVQCGGACTGCFECSDTCHCPSGPSMGCESCLARVQFTNCIIAANFGRDFAGGAIRSLRKTQFTNCVLAFNETEDCQDPGGGAAIHNGHNSYSLLDNCIVWGNRGPQGCSLGILQQQISPPGTFTARNSDVEELCPGPTYACGTGNLSVDPEFVNEPDIGSDGIWGTSDDVLADLHLFFNSQCRDAGSSSYLPVDVGDVNENGNETETLPRDLDLIRRVLGPSVDMGPFETGCAEDLDYTCEIDGLDLAVLLGAWTGSQSVVPCPPYPGPDFNEDCKMNGLDLAILLAAWGPCPDCELTEGGGAQGAAAASTSADSGCGDIEEFMQWAAAGDWDAFLGWLDCVTGDS